MIWEAMPSTLLISFYVICFICNWFNGEWLHQTAALEEQKNESAEEVDAEDESNSSETKPEAAEPDSKSDGINEKPDMNDVPAKENKVIAWLLFFTVSVVMLFPVSPPPWILLLFATKFISTAGNLIL